MKTDFKLLRGYVSGYVWLPYIITHETIATRVQAAADRILVEGRYGIANRIPINSRYGNISIEGR